MKFSGIKILVTGGAGFIGSHIVDSLVKQGAKVIVYDNFSFGRKENLIKAQKKIRLIKGDILDYKSLKKAAIGVDFISHQAAQLEIFRAVNEPVTDLKINTVGTINVLKAAKENRVKKLVFASSACVYGQPLEIPQTEGHPTNPNWAYGVSKLAAEKYCQIFAQENKIPLIILRYGIVYGPREWYRRVLTIFIKRMINNLPLVVFGDGKQYRDFIYVDDVVNFHNLCLTKIRHGVKIYNVGTGKKTTINQLAKLIIKLSNKKINVIKENLEEGNYSKYVKDKKRNPAELKGMCLSIASARKELNWQPRWGLEEGILKEISWAKENLSLWGKINYTKK